MCREVRRCVLPSKPPLRRNNSIASPPQPPPPHLVPSELSLLLRRERRLPPKLITTECYNLEQPGATVFVVQSPGAGVVHVGQGSGRCHVEHEQHLALVFREGDALIIVQR